MSLRAALARSSGRRLSALKIRNFRLYFFGSVVSTSGTWMQTTAQAWLVLKITNSPVALATVAALQFLPITLFTLFGGALADQLPRRPILFATQCLAALQATLLGVLTLTGAVQIWHVYLLAATLGTINALDTPLRQAFVSELVGRDRLPNAVPLNSLVQNLGRIIGPATGGMVIGFLGLPTAFFLNAASFSGLICGLLLIRPGELHPRVVRPRRGNVFVQVGEGLAFARRTPTILFLFILAGFVGMFGYNFTTTIPLVATYLVHASATEFGIINSCLGTGSMVAALALSGHGPPTVGRILAAATLFGLALIAVSLSRNFVLTGGLFTLVGVAAVTFSASVNTSLQLQAPDHMRGRMASIFHLMVAGSSPIGAEITGAISHGLGVGGAVAFNGSLCLVGVGAALAYRLRHRWSAAFDITAPAAVASGPAHSPAAAQPVAPVTPP